MKYLAMILAVTLLVGCATQQSKLQKVQQTEILLSTAEAGIHTAYTAGVITQADLQKAAPYESIATRTVFAAEAAALSGDDSTYDVAMKAASAATDEVIRLNLEANQKKH